MNPPPGRLGRPHIFNYITQVAIKPPSFALFVRNPGDIHFSYERYLINRIRETFGFEEVPIRLFFRKKGATVSSFRSPDRPQPFIEGELFMSIRYLIGDERYEQGFSTGRLLSSRHF